VRDDQLVNKSVRDRLVPVETNGYPNLHIHRQRKGVVLVDDAKHNPYKRKSFVK
jgi:hypothetical protein